MRSSSNLKNKISLDKSWRAQLVCTNVQMQEFKTTTRIQSGEDDFAKPRLVTIFITKLEIAKILCCFKLVLQEKIGKEITESSR